VSALLCACPDVEMEYIERTKYAVHHAQKQEESVTEPVADQSPSLRVNVSEDTAVTAVTASSLF